MNSKNFSKENIKKNIQNIQKDMENQPFNDIDCHWETDEILKQMCREIFKQNGTESKEQ